MEVELEKLFGCPKAISSGHSTGRVGTNTEKEIEPKERERISLQPRSESEPQGSQKGQVSLVKPKEETWSCSGVRKVAFFVRGLGCSKRKGSM